MSILYRNLFQEDGMDEKKNKKGKESLIDGNKGKEEKEDQYKKH